MDKRQLRKDKNANMLKKDIVIVQQIETDLHLGVISTVG